MGIDSLSHPPADSLLEIKLLSIFIWICSYRIKVIDT